MEIELESIQDLSYAARVGLLQLLDFDADSEGYVIKNGERVIDKYVGVAVSVNHMVIAPNGIVILDENPASIAGYMQEYDISLKQKQSQPENPTNRG